MIEDKDYYDAKFAALHQEIEALRLLKEHDLASIHQRMDERRTNIANALTVVTESTRIAAVQVEKRFESVNEFRKTLSDQTLTFVPRVEVAAAHEAMQREIESLKIEHSRLAVTSEANEKQSAVERAQLEQRLHTMNEFRSQLKDQAVGFYTRNEAEASLRPLAERIHQLGRPNYVVFASAAAITLTLCSAAWAVINLQISVAIAPLNNSTEVSRADRAQLNARIERLDEFIGRAIQERSDQIATIRLDLEKLRRPTPSKGE